MSSYFRFNNLAHLRKMYVTKWFDISAHRELRTSSTVFRNKLPSNNFHNDIHRFKKVWFLNLFSQNVFFPVQEVSTPTTENDTMSYGFTYDPHADIHNTVGTISYGRASTEMISHVKANKMVRTLSPRTSYKTGISPAFMTWFIQMNHTSYRSEQNMTG